MIVEHYIRKEYQRRGGVLWQALLWEKPGTVPRGAIMAEVPHPSKRPKKYLHDVGMYLHGNIIVQTMKILPPCA